MLEQKLESVSSNPLLLDYINILAKKSMVLIAYVVLIKVSNCKSLQKTNSKISVTEQKSFMRSQVGKWGLPLFSDSEDQIFNLNHYHINRWLLTPVLKCFSLEVSYITSTHISLARISHIVPSNPKGSGKYNPPHPMHSRRR